jgi:monomeric isocitrate dehydrogenase
MENQERKKVRKCRICGCTAEQACPGGCYWVNYDLCSKCVDKEKSTLTRVELKSKTGLNLTRVELKSKTSLKLRELLDFFTSYFDNKQLIEEWVEKVESLKEKDLVYLDEMSVTMPNYASDEDEEIFVDTLDNFLLDFFNQVLDGVCNVIGSFIKEEEEANANKSTR